MVREVERRVVRDWRGSGERVVRQWRESGERVVRQWSRCDQFF